MIIKEFLKYIIQQKKYSANTSVNYSVDLSQFQVFIQENFSNNNILECSHQDIRFWMSQMIEREKLSTRTIHRKISTLRSFYKYALRLHYIEQNPMLRIVAPKANKKLPVYVSEKSMNDIVEVSFENESVYKKILHFTIIETFYNVGIRLSELKNLKTKDIDFNNKTIKVLGKGKKERIIPFIPEFEKALKAYLFVKNEKFPNNTIENLFLLEKGKPLYEKYIYRVVQKRLASVTTLKKKSPHVLRHTYATHLSNSGAPIADLRDLLGHVSLSATQVYTHTSLEKIREIYKQAHPKAQ
jgi:integrase/recombinase XerC